MVEAGKDTWKWYNSLELTAGSGDNGTPNETYTFMVE